MVFAPIVDAQQKNTASAAVGISSLNTTTASFASQNNSTVPVDSTFQNVIDIEQAAGTIGPALQKIPNPYTQAIGAALTTIAGLLGSSTATQTNSSVVATQNTLQVGASQTQSQTAQASQGGPGVGDLITYYYNARVVWYADGQAMHLAVLGLDGTVQINASKLTAAWVALQSQPKGTIDPVSHLDVDSLHSLLLLDPFFNGTQGANPTAPLAGPRFVPVSNHVVEIAGGQLTEQFTHQFSTTDLRTTQTTQINSQTDKAGFLSFLGIGVTDSNTIQTSISQGTALQNTSGQTATQSFTFNSNPTENYSCEVYFDIVFGSFVFRQVTPSSSAPLIHGTVVDADGKPLANAKVTAKAGSDTFVTAADGQGNFQFRLPGVRTAAVTISSTMGAKTSVAQVVTDKSAARTARLQIR
jgi:hypothetical protein